MVLTGAETCLLEPGLTSCPRFGLRMLPVFAIQVVGLEKCIEIDRLARFVGVSSGDGLLVSISLEASFAGGGELLRLLPFFTGLEIIDACSKWTTTCSWVSTQIRLGGRAERMFGLLSDPRPGVSRALFTLTARAWKNEPQANMPLFSFRPSPTGVFSTSAGGPLWSREILGAATGKAMV